MTPSSRNVDELRAKSYDATVVDVRRVHADLMVLRVSPKEKLDWVAGQYTTLGLGDWEPRVPGCQHEETPPKGKLIRRAYSMSSPIVDAEGHYVSE